MAEERWQPVPGYVGRYMVSDQGRVFSVRRRQRVRQRDKRYPKVTLSADGAKCTFYVHTLVLTAFVGPRPVGMECRHRNGDALDNRLSNLAWGTSLENSADTLKHGTRNRGERHGMAVLSDADVATIRAAGGSVPQTELARRFRTSPATICRILSGKTRPWQVAA